MRSPARILRAGAIEGVTDRGPIHEWSEGRSSLVLDVVEHAGAAGAVLCYDNPPVHQIGNPGLDAMLAALAELAMQKDRFAFLLLAWPCDPVHAGGDIKESLARLESTEARRTELEAAGAPRDRVEALYDWADGRLDKGQALYRAIRGLGTRLRTVGICGGGMRYGGSAEVNLMAEWLVGDSRSGMCFSEAMIGLIPGWAGVGRAVTKAGPVNARFMAETGREVKAKELLDAGIYDEVVDVDEPLPRMERTKDPEADRAAYARALEAHDDRVWPRLLLRGLEIGTCAGSALPRKRGSADRKELASPEAIRAEVGRRADPSTYEGCFGAPIRELPEALKKLGRPLAPQSVAELEALLEPVDAGELSEDAFVEAEKLADARLYRDARLKVGIQATLEQRIADFRARNG